MNHRSPLRCGQGRAQLSESQTVCVIDFNFYLTSLAITVLTDEMMDLSFNYALQTLYIKFKSFGLQVRLASGNMDGMVSVYMMSDKTK